MISRVLSDSQINRIHESSLAILERTGVHIPHEEMLSRFAGSGAQVDHARQIVRMPAELVMRSLDQAGKQFTLHGRDVSRTAEFGVGKRNYNSIAGEAYWVNELHGPRRFAAMDDVAAAVRFADALDHITMPGAMHPPIYSPLGET
jgi:trimethylamine--corrinoid protein Co-methyltransferase